MKNKYDVFIVYKSDAHTIRPDYDHIKVVSGWDNVKKMCGNVTLHYNRTGCNGWDYFYYGDDKMVYVRRHLDQ